MHVHRSGQLQSKTTPCAMYCIDWSQDSVEQHCLDLSWHTLVCSTCNERQPGKLTDGTGPHSIQDTDGGVQPHSIVDVDEDSDADPTGQGSLWNDLDDQTRHAAHVCISGGETPWMLISILNESAVAVTHAQKLGMYNNSYTALQKCGAYICMMLSSTACIPLKRTKRLNLKLLMMP